MQWSTELDLALDIDEVTAAETHLRGNAARCAEGKISEADEHVHQVNRRDLAGMGSDPHDKILADSIDDEEAVIVTADR